MDGNFPPDPPCLYDTYYLYSSSFYNIVIARRSQQISNIPHGTMPELPEKCDDQHRKVMEYIFIRRSRIPVLNKREASL